MESEKDYTKIKTLQDAMEKLGSENESVKEYAFVCSMKHPSKGLLSYLRLRIIVEALNGTWKPNFTDEKQYTYWPWFYLYTNEELDKMNETERKGCILFVNANSEAHCGFMYAHTSFSPLGTTAGIGSQLCLKSMEIAEYAGRQFADVYFDFLIG